MKHIGKGAGGGLLKVDPPGSALPSGKSHETFGQPSHTFSLSVAGDVLIVGSAKPDRHPLAKKGWGDFGSFRV